jgi:acyl carrier protein
VEDKIYQVFSSVMEVTIDNVSDQSNSNTVENWDSLKHMDLVLSLEEVFNIQFSDQEIVNMDNMISIKKYIQEKINV